MIFLLKISTFPVTVHSGNGNASALSSSAAWGAELGPLLERRAEHLEGGVHEGPRVGLTSGGLMRFY